MKSKNVILTICIATALTMVAVGLLRHDGVFVALAGTSLAGVIPLLASKPGRCGARRGCDCACGDSCTCVNCRCGSARTSEQEAVGLVVPERL